MSLSERPGPAAPALPPDLELDRLIGAFEQMGDAVVITTTDLALPDPRILAVNPALCRMTGYTSAELIGKTPRIFQGPKTDRATLERLKEQCRRGERFVGETVNYRKDRSEYVVEWSIDSVRGADGNVTCFVAVQRDVTARAKLTEEMQREAEKSLAAASERMAALVDTVVVLEKTKRSFRSSDLGKLRERLMRVIRGESPAP